MLLPWLREDMFVEMLKICGTYSHCWLNALPQISQKLDAGVGSSITSGAKKKSHHASMFDSSYASVGRFAGFPPTLW